MINTTQNIATKHHLEHSLKANISCFQVNYYDNNGVWQQTRHIAWTEDSRITNIVDKSYHSYYTYDDGGERVLKITGPSTILDINADMISYQSTLKNVTLYTSPYLVAHNKGYTKHFYAGSERVCAAIGEGGLNSLTPCIGNDQTLKNTTNALFNSTIGSMGGRFLLENQSCLINTGDVPNELLAEFENVAVNVKLSSGVDASIFHTAINKYCSQNKANSATYYYHSDHLGSASWITNGSGTPVQHLQYMPYGEPFVNERTSSYEERFTFTGKERDSETGFSYFGARYYDSDILTGWLSVDPMADKYPSLSPYAYCGWNPVKLVDPDGMEIDWVKDASGEIYWDNNAVSQATTKEGEIYLGKEGCKYNNDIGTITHYKSNGEKEYYPYSSPNSNSFGAFPINIPTESYKSGYAQFGSNRSNNRKHAGSDLYAPEGTAVFSTNDGVIITNPYYFYKGTKAIEINHSSYTARYCEIIPSFDISAGMHVKKGEFLGILKAMNIGQSNNTMLHFEMYNNTAKGALTVTSNFPYKRREDLIDPTSFLNSLLFISPAKCVLK